jgi:ArsR family transcriptional regulator
MTVPEDCGCDADRSLTVPPEENPAVADAAFKALASSQRRQLLRIIATHTSADGVCCETEVCACKLADALDLAPSTISHHMAVLVKAGLVSATKRGLWVYYRLERETLARVATELTLL